MKKALAAVIAVVAALLGPARTGTAASTSVTVTAAHLGTNVQVPINYECPAGILPQVDVTLTDVQGHTAQPGGPSPAAGTLFPVLPECTGGPQTYVIYLQATAAPLVTGQGTYAATLYQARTGAAPSAPGPRLWTATGLQVTVDNTYGIVAAPPGPVTDTSYTATPTSITLSWAPPADETGQPVPGYIIQCTTPQPSPPSACTNGQLVGGTSATFAGLSPNQQYDFTINGNLTVQAYTTVPFRRQGRPAGSPTSPRQRRRTPSRCPGSRRATTGDPPSPATW